MRHFKETLTTLTEKIYKILLDEKLFGTTKLEFGDPTMGIVFGQIFFAEKNIGYDFIKKYCIDKLIEIQSDYPIDKIISTGLIGKLKIYNSENIELVGLESNIEGMDNDSYTITVFNINSEGYKKEFQEHIAEFEQKFDN